MSSVPFVPFGLTAAEEEQRQVLVDGVPPWMKQSLLMWIRARVVDAQGWPRMRTLYEVESSCMLTLGLPANVTLIRDTQLLGLLDRLAPHLLLRVADYLAASLSTGHQGGSIGDALDALGKILDNSSSRYELGTRDGKRRLIERVPRGVQDSAEQTIRDAGTAGRLLAQAWANVHQLEPDDSGAYAAAVKAVEAASFVALGNANPEATLGHSIRTIEQDETYRLPFMREHTRSPTRDVLLGMLRMLWRGHRDRHGSDAYTGVTHEEAKAAVTMAVTLVGWFAGGAVQQRSTEDYG